MRKLIAPLLIACGLVPGAMAETTADPAIATVTLFQNALEANMRGESAKLADVIRTQFNVDVMSAFIAGPTWAAAPAADRTLLSGALTRYLVARFAHEFDRYEGEQFRVDPTVLSRGPDKMIRTEVRQPSAASIHLDYRLRAYGGQWRIIDVYYDGVSQLATQRADVATLAPQPIALAAHFETAATALQ
jgi:phospholipid transport system substrate-binding protein